MKKPNFKKGPKAKTKKNVKAKAQPTTQKWVEVAGQRMLLEDPRRMLLEDPRISLYNQLVQCNARLNDLRAMNGRTSVQDSGGAGVSTNPLDNFLFDL